MKVVSGALSTTEKGIFKFLQVNTYKALIGLNRGLNSGLKTRYCGRRESNSHGRYFLPLMPLMLSYNTFAQS
jgi:hypothetical protein